MAGLLLVFSFGIFAAPAAQAETRALKLYFIHTKEKAEITFKRNGRYDQDGLNKINRFLRDWRRNEPTKMDPRLLDLLWETYKAAGARDHIHIVSAYRSPATNSMLRSRSKGVAEKSQHMLGKAIDFYIPGVSLKTLRDTGLRMQVGGVGYYPRSGSPFVHLDVGSVRHWPRLSRKELVGVFPNGNTLHVPSDGKPLPGYQTALASYEARKKSGTTALALASSSSRSRSGGLLSALFGGGADEEEDRNEAVRAPVRAAKAAAEPEPAAPVAKVEEPPAVTPAEVAPQEPEAPVAIIAALPARSIPLPAVAPRPKADVGSVIAEAKEIPAAPADMPFAMARTMPGETDEPAADLEGQALVASVPLPVWRPDQTVATAPEAGIDNAVLASLNAIPAEAPRSMALAAPLPPALPEGKSVPLEGGFSVAGLPVASELEAEVRESQARLAALSASPAEPTRVLSGSKSTMATAVGARTTPKTSRARPRHTRPDPKPIVQAAQPDAARWALSSESSMVEVAGGTRNAEPVARLLLREAPRQVYADGFQQAAIVAEPARFSGKAVRFMPIARFATN
jgi:uncharacterized protein YcbK (DUF882 family)